MNNNELTLEQKFAKCMVSLRKLRPFYAALYESIDKVETDSVRTAAVDIKKMYYNKEFMESLPFPEFMFVILHELTHIALMHVARAGDKDALAWNMCTDYIVNHILVKEFNLSESSSYVVNGVLMPKTALFMHLTDNDSAESLYSQLMKKSQSEREEAYSPYLIGGGNGDNTGSTTSDNAENGDGGTTQDKSKTKDKNDSDNSDSSDDDLDDTTEASGDDTKNDTNKSNGEDKSTGDGFGNSCGQGNSGSGNNQNTNTLSNPDGTDNGSDDNETLQHGPQYAFSDLRIEEAVDSGESTKELDIEQAKVIIEAARMRAELEKATASSGTGLLDKEITEVLKSKNDWIKMLQKYCIAMTCDDTSFARPDKRMFYQDAIYPGRAEEEYTHLPNVTFCIDTSGSIDSKDLGYILGQIDSICTYYSVEFDILCWDTEVVSVNQGNTIRDIINQGLTGGGGTDPTCIFEYLIENKKNPNVIIIFTDGYFYNFKEEKLLENRIKRKFKDIIWVMTRGYNKNFKPAIGKMAYTKFSD